MVGHQRCVGGCGLIEPDDAALAAARVGGFARALAVHRLDRIVDGDGIELIDRQTAERHAADGVHAEWP